jgi:hypothetical protein
MQAHRHVIDHLNAVGTGHAVDPKLSGALGAQKPGIRILECLRIERIPIGKSLIGSRAL